MRPGAAVPLRGDGEEEDDDDGGCIAVLTADEEISYICDAISRNSCDYYARIFFLSAMESSYKLRRWGLLPSSPCNVRTVVRVGPSTDVREQQQISGKRFLAQSVPEGTDDLGKRSHAYM